MPSTHVPAPSPPATARHPGWRIVAFAAVGLAMTAPGQTVGVSVFVDPMIEGLGLTRSQVSTAYLLGTLVGAASLPLVGRAIDRWGVRWVMTLVAFAFGAALSGMAAVAGLLSLIAGFSGIRLLGQGSLTLVSTTSVALWFDRRRGLAMGVCMAVGTACMSAAPLALAAVIGRVGWRGAWLAAAAAVWLVVVPIAIFGMRDRPRAPAPAPDQPAPPAPDPSPHGSGPAVLGVGGASNAPDPAVAADPARSWTRREASRTAMFWAVTAAVATVGMVGTGLAFHQISILGARGLTVEEAAANFIPHTVAIIASTVGVGWLIDRVRPRWVLIGAMGCLALAMGLVQVAAPGWRAVAFALALGAAGGAIRAQEATALPRYFGTAHLGAIRGFVMAVAVTGTALGPLALAVGVERFGSYGPVLNALLALPVAVCVLAAAAPVPDHALHTRVRGRLSQPR